MNYKGSPLEKQGSPLGKNSKLYKGRLLNRQEGLKGLIWFLKELVGGRANQGGKSMKKCNRGYELEE